MQKIPDRIKLLIEKQLDHSINHHELEELDDWYTSFNDEFVIVENSDSEESIKSRLKSRIDLSLEERSFYHSWIKYAKVAAMLGLVMSMTVWVYLNNKRTNDVLFATEVAKVDDILAPRNGARLILSDSQELELNEPSDLSLINSSTFNASYNESGQFVIGETNDGDSSLEVKMNTLVIPKGKLFQVVLSDHTKVWLNADSRLNFPDNFSEHERKVYLTGEAYFEVEKEENRPFIIETENQQIKVLGTKFNVSSYPESTVEKTSLYNGSVEVTNLTSKERSVLKPREEVMVSAGEMKIRILSEMNASEWRNHTFVFEEENLHSVLRKVGRWYNVDIDGVGQLSDKQLSGKVRTQATLTETLQIISLASGIDFKLEENKIVAINK